MFHYLVHTYELLLSNQWHCEERVRRVLVSIAQLAWFGGQRICVCHTWSISFGHVSLEEKGIFAFVLFGSVRLFNST